MTRLQRNANIGAVIVPTIAFVVAVVMMWNKSINSLDLAVLVVYYFICAIGVTVGYHRLLTHNAFATHRYTKYGFAVLGSLALQGSVGNWVADHRKHHAFADEDGDPHSPHTGGGTGFGGAMKGLWHAHMGWLWHTYGQADMRKYAPEIVEDPIMKRISIAFPLIAVGGILLPAFVELAIVGTMSAFWHGLIWGGLVRIFIGHHVTWSVNSLCHFHGERRFAVEDHSTNVKWLALFTIGESWHHNHHAFPRAAVQGLKRWEVDLSGYFISALEAVGLAWNVVRISPERQHEMLTEQPTKSEKASVKT